MNDNDLRRVRRRLGIVAPMYWSSAVGAACYALLTVLFAVQAVRHPDDLDYRWLGTMQLAVMALFVWLMAPRLRQFHRQYWGLRRDLRNPVKEIVVSPLRDKYVRATENSLNLGLRHFRRSARNGLYYLRFDIGTVQCGERLYRQIKLGDILTLTVSKCGRELLAVERTEIDSVPTTPQLPPAARR